MGANALARAQSPSKDAIFIPAGHYYSREIAALEAERVWPRTWLIVCREQELERRGDFVTCDVGKESFFVVKTEDGVKGYYNVCQHRGRRLRDGNGNAASIYCPFHAWRWNLDGSLAHRTDDKDWDGEPGCAHSDVALKEVRVDAWGGWIWATMDPNAKPLLEYLGPIPQILAPLELENCRIAWHHVIRFPCNWKLVLDAFNEGYHTAGTHFHLKQYETPYSTSKAIGDHGWFAYTPKRGKTPDGETGEDGASTPKKIDFRKLVHDRLKSSLEMLRCLVTEYGVEAARRLTEELPEDASLEEVLAKHWELHRVVMEERGAKWPEKITPQMLREIGTDYHIFPNQICLPCVDGAEWYRCRPDGDDPERCVFEIWWLMRFPPGGEPPVVHEHFDTLEGYKGKNPFLEQDFSNLIASQRGVHSRGFQGLRTNPRQEMAVRNFHMTLDRYLYGKG